MLVSEIIAVYSGIITKPEHILQVKYCPKRQGQKTGLAGKEKPLISIYKINHCLSTVAHQNIYFKL